MPISQTCPSNQWQREHFFNLVDQNEQQEVRVAAAYDRPINREVIRAQIIESMLAYAMPAGNA